MLSTLTEWQLKSKLTLVTTAMLSFLSVLTIFIILVNLQSNNEINSFGDTHDQAIVNISVRKCTDTHNNVRENY